MTSRSLLVALAATPFLPLLSAQNVASQLPATESAAAPAKSSWTDALDWRCVGPANMGGRMLDIAVVHSDPSTWWIATASGGLLKTTNNGVSFEHQFDQEAVVSIGAIDICQAQPDVIYVGTGENNPRNSVSYGNGVYKSVDGGKTWKHVGLKDSFQTGALIVHPENPDIVYVGALGRLYGPGGERGLYKTTDGGENWERIHYVDESTGIIDMILHPEDPDTLVFATYQRQRDAFDGNAPAVKIAPGSGIWRTRDGGETFEELTEGLPTVDKGRIGLDYYKKDPNVIFALVESARIGQPGKDQGWWGMAAENADVGAKVSGVAKDGAAAKAGIAVGDVILQVGDDEVMNSRALLLALANYNAGEEVEITYVNSGEKKTATLTMAEWPKSSASSGGRRRGGGGEGVRPPSFGEFLGGQPANLQDLQGRNGWENGGLYRSDDGGDTWRRINSIDPRPMYFSRVRVDPNDDNHLFVTGISASRSKDGGKTFTRDASRGVHSDHHDVWIDPRDGRHMILASDGGLYVTWDRADTWQHINHMALGQFYHVAVGPRRDYWVYGGLQDNGTWGAPHRGSRGNGAVNEDWLRIGGGDGFLVQVDANDPDQIYYESQNGSMGRTHLRTMASGRMRPRAPDTEPTSLPLPRQQRTRFNWRTPFLLSHHNSRIYYCAGNYVWRSLDRGDDLKVVSPEITLTDRGSATALAESPRDPHVLYVGTDDGALWGTRDNGQTWTELFDWGQGEEATADIGETEGGCDEAGEGDDAFDIRSLVPDPRWVNCIEASHFDTARAYVVLDAHRSSDDSPYVLMTEDHGKTWKSIVSNLPKWGTTRVLREDLFDENVLYLGTEFGIWASWNRGGSWERIDNNLPTVAIHEIAQHRASGDIVVATHGRSIWVLNGSLVRQMTQANRGADVFLAKPASVIRWGRRHSQGRSGGSQSYTGARSPGSAQLNYSLGKRARSVTVRVTDAAGEVLQETKGATETGLHSVSWSARGGIQTNAQGRRFRAPSATPGTYYVVLTVDGTDYRESFEVEQDPNLPVGGNSEFEYEEFEEEEEVGRDGDR